MNNILYYGNGYHFNDTIFEILKIDKNLKKSYHKNIEYIEDMKYFIFPTINQTILSFIKSIISTTTINNKPRTIILLDIDKIDYDSSSALRIILEKYSLYTHFIATSTNISKIDKPILSRFFLKRQKVPPTKIITPLHKINYKPTIHQISELTKKCIQYNIKDLVLDLLQITVYKTQFIQIACDLEYQYTKHQNKHLCIENLLLNCFYPPNIYKGKDKTIHI